jgi:hypothetical protein
MRARPQVEELWVTRARFSTSPRLALTIASCSMDSTCFVSVIAPPDFQFTYTRHAGQDLDEVVRQLSAEALELSELVDVLRVLVQLREDVLEKVTKSVVLHLENPFSGNRVALTRKDDRSAGLDRGSSKSEGQSREEEFETHDESVVVVSWSSNEGLLSSCGRPVDACLLLMMEKADPFIRVIKTDSI